MSGRLFVIEGLDGSGKSTQFPLLAQALRECGKACREISFPDYQDESSALVKMYLSGAFGSDADAVNAYAASSFYAVDRFAAYQRHWGADYRAGKVIVAARYTSSNAVHQMSKLPKREWDAYLEWLEDFEFCKMQIPRPDLVAFLDMPVEVSQSLLLKRYQGNEQRRDIHESNLKYMERCREAALYAAQKCGWTVIPCAQNGQPKKITAIHSLLMQAVEPMLKG